MNKVLLLFLLLVSSSLVLTEHGYDLWLRYVPIKDVDLLKSYQASLTQLIISDASDTLKAARDELNRGTQGMLQTKLVRADAITQDGSIVIGTPSSSHIIASEVSNTELTSIGNEGYLIKTVNVNQKSCIIIAASKDIGALYGVFNFLKLLQQNKAITQLSISEKPKLDYRILDHWDNLDGTIERGYAGYTLWDWKRLPGYLDPRYIDYARADASIGINGAVLNNVNAQPEILTSSNLVKVATLANAFRPYGVKVYLTAKFDSPMTIGHLSTADPLNQAVIDWWKAKVDQIYKSIPDFGGFLIKADSEGQPGPQKYNRTHAEAANMFAEALAPHGGIVMWRAFVYSLSSDRSLQPYKTFLPLDGEFASNVFLQTKNGPIDFQPREPFHPLFGAMPNTNLMLEVQITQEYLGFSVQLVYLGPLYKEALDSDTYSQGKGSTVAKVIEGKIGKSTKSGIAGVANVGGDINWTGHHFAQANWYVFGALAWNPDRTAEQIAEEWLIMTFTNDENFVNPIKELMMNSRQTAVNYMTPLGLNHLMRIDTHYGPGPWFEGGASKNSDYHKADAIGVGYDRTSKGNNATGQYFSPWREILDDITTIPDDLLLWFHHVPWNYTLSSTGRILWDEIVYRYYGGVDTVKQWEKTWESVKGKIDEERFNSVAQLLAEQRREAIWWRDSCVLYFQTFSNLPIPKDLEPPKYPLSHYQSIPFPDRDSDSDSIKHQIKKSQTELSELVQKIENNERNKQFLGFDW